MRWKKLRREESCHLLSYLNREIIKKLTNNLKCIVLGLNLFGGEEEGVRLLYREVGRERGREFNGKH